MKTRLDQVQKRLTSLSLFIFQIAVKLLYKIFVESQDPLKLALPNHTSQKL